MSDPYGQYPPQYSSPHPGGGQGYAPPADQNYAQHGYPQQGYQEQAYSQQGYPSQPSPYAGQSEFGAPHRQDSYGPPQAGGFQHGQQDGQFGAYDASNPQGHPGYYGGSQDARGYGDQQYQQYQQPQQPPYQHDPNGQPGYPPRDPNAPFDPNAPEGERGLGTALMGGAAGYWVGHKKGHGFLGAIGGAIAGNFLGDKVSEHNKPGRPGQQQGGSSWGGK